MGCGTDCNGGRIVATYTLSSNSNWSAIKSSISNGDTVALAGYTLTLDEAPTLTGIAVTTTGTAGKVVISGAYDLSTWSFTAGTGVLITTVPAGCAIGSLTGGSSSGSHGCTTNNGTITTCKGGTGAARGVLHNHGTITTLTGGSATNAHGCYENHGLIVTCNGSASHSARGVDSNFGEIETCNGGAVSSAPGCLTNYGVIDSCNGGGNATAYGCENNIGQVLGGTDGLGAAVAKFRGGVKFIDGPSFEMALTVDPSYPQLYTVYIMTGALSESATIPEGAEQVELFGSGSTPAAAVPFSIGGRFGRRA